MLIIFLFCFFYYSGVFLSALGAAGGLPGPMAEEAGGRAFGPPPLHRLEVALAAPQQPPVHQKKIPKKSRKKQKINRKKPKKNTSVGLAATVLASTS